MMLEREFVERAFDAFSAASQPTRESKTCLEFLDRASEALSDQQSLTAFSRRPRCNRVPRRATPLQRARENLVHVLFNHNDFVTIRSNF